MSIISCLSKTFFQSDCNLSLIFLLARNQNSNSLISWESLARILRQPKEIDWFGLSVIYGITFGGFLPPVLAIVDMYLGLDPWQYVLEDIIPPEIYGHWIFISVHKAMATLCMFIGCSELTRLIPMIFILVILPILACTDAIRQINEFHDTCNKSEDLLILYRKYIHLQINNLNMKRYMNVALFLLAVFGTMLVCLFNFVTLRLFRVLPFVMYLMFVSGNAVILLIIGSIVPCAVRVHEDSKAGLTSWRSCIQPRNKCIRKKFFALRFLELHVEVGGCNIYLLQKSFKLEYWSMVLNNTTTLLLSVAPSTVQMLAM